jgi:hypothetical protein
MGTGNASDTLKLLEESELKTIELDAESYDSIKRRTITN